MRKARAERGQILPIVALALVVLFGGAALSIDVGYAYFAKRQLQAATDAAALAGAQDLPNTITAFQTAATYATANSPKNTGTFSFTYEAKCTATAIIATGCNALVNPNSLVVTGSASTNTWFAGIFGIKHFDVTAHASACSPCSSTPVDIVIAIDRTGSMCKDEHQNTDCSDMNSAKDGVQTMLTILNPPAAQVGMVAFPPVETTASSKVCDAPFDSSGGPSLSFNGYDAPGRGYLTDALNGDYKLANGDPNTNSGLYKHTVPGSKPSYGCVEAGGSTSYSEALRQAKAELVRHGRPNVPGFIVFLTDGEANLGSVYPKSGGQPDAKYPPGGDEDQKPCLSAEKVADEIKAAGITIYSIGYAVGDSTPCTAGDWGPDVYVPKTDDVWDSKHKKIITPGVPAHYDPCVPQESSSCYHVQGSVPEYPAITSHDTLLDIASKPSTFYEKVNPGQLDSIFAAIAADIGAGSSRLVDDGF